MQAYRRALTKAAQRARAAEDPVADATGLQDDRIGRFEAAYVGQVAEKPFRLNGSSGGLTSWVAAEPSDGTRVTSRGRRRDLRPLAPGTSGLP